MIKLATLVTLTKDYRHGMLLSIPFITSILILASLFYFADVNLILKNINYYDLKWYPVLFLLFILSIAIVALRLFLSMHLCGLRYFILSLDSSILHILLLNTLPARLGDISYPLILKANLNIIAAKSIANLIIIRIYDYISVIILLSLSSWIYFFKTNKTLDFQIYILAGIPAILIFVLLLRAVIRISILCIPEKKIFVFKKDIHQLFSEINDNFTGISFTDHIYLLLTTSLRWLIACLVFFSIFNGMGINIGFSSSVLITAGVNLSVIIPLQTIGGFGLTESVLAYFLNLFGYPVSNAIAIAISTRILWLFTLFSLGGLWILFRRKILNYAMQNQLDESTTIK